MLDWHLMKGCFSSAEMRGIWSESATISAWINVEQVLAQVQCDLGLIPQAAAEAVARFSLADVDQDRLHADMMLVGRPVVGLVAQMREHACPDLAQHIHFNSTTQDVMDTAVALQMKSGLAEVGTEVDKLVARLESHITASAETKLIGRTNGQHAVPMRLATKFELWKSELMRRRQALTDAAGRGLLVQVGGPLGDLSKYEAGTGARVKSGTAKALGLGSAEPHWQNARDGVADIVTALGALCASLCKMAHNINLLSSSDIAEMSECHENGKGVSSSMHHKRNQRASEFAEAIGRLGRQRAEQIGELGLHQHERSGGVWIGEWVVVPEVFLLTSGTLMWSDKMLSDLVIHTDCMDAKI